MTFAVGTLALAVALCSARNRAPAWCRGIGPGSPANTFTGHEIHESIRQRGQRATCSFSWRKESGNAHSNDTAFARLGDKRDLVSVVDGNRTFCPSTACLAGYARSTAELS